MRGLLTCSPLLSMSMGMKDMSQNCIGVFLLLLVNDSIHKKASIFKREWLAKATVATSSRSIYSDPSTSEIVM